MVYFYDLANMSIYDSHWMLSGSLEAVVWHVYSVVAAIIARARGPFTYEVYKGGGKKWTNIGENSP